MLDPLKMCMLLMEEKKNHDSYQAASPTQRHQSPVLLLVNFKFDGADSVMLAILWL